MQSHPSTVPHPYPAVWPGAAIGVSVPEVVLRAREAGPRRAGRIGQGRAQYGGWKWLPGSSADAAPAAVMSAPKLRITAVTIRAIVFIRIKGLRSIGGGRG